MPFTWHASTTTESFADVKFPGILAQCETCHLPGTYDFRNADSAAALPGKQYRTMAAGTFNPTTPVDLFALSPYVTPGIPYGSGFSFSFSEGPKEAAPTTLVTSPVATTCFACHDTDVARAHMTSNGGSIYAQRSTALAVVEQCMVCHGPGRIADIKTMHNK